MAEKVKVGEIHLRAPDGSFTGEVVPIYRDQTPAMTAADRKACDRAAREVFLPLFRKSQEAQKSES
ncbi:MAG: hypothetical protein GX628_05225 [Clostridiales bacterium]|nr:hypothetical protein [Clostridiales bacterium]